MLSDTIHLTKINILWNIQADSRHRIIDYSESSNPKPPYQALTAMNGTSTARSENRAAGGKQKYGTMDYFY